MWDISDTGRAKPGYQGIYHTQVRVMSYLTRFSDPDSRKRTKASGTVDVIE